MMLASSKAEQGVSVAGFNTRVFPVASAGPIFHTAIMSGKFHGMICPHTPNGSRCTQFCDCAGNCGTWISVMSGTCSAISAK
jgi:hypothetical protein